MGITKTILKRPISAIMIILALAVFGISSIFGFRMEQIPDIEIPIMLVLTVYPGADPESVENLVSTPIESSAGSLSGVETVVSYSMENYSMVMLQYEYGIDITAAHQDLRAALDTTGSFLPEDAREPIIMEMNVDAVATMMITLSADENTDMMAFLDDGLQDELESLSSVAEVSVSGGDQNYIRVLLKPDMLNQYGLSISSVSQYIAATDFMIPVGSVNQGSQSISVTASADNDTIQALRNVPLFSQTGAVLKLADVADVDWAVKDRTSLSRLNGEDTITISVTKNQSAGTVDVSNDVRKVLSKYLDNQEDIHYTVFYDGADDVKSSLSAVGSTLALGVVLSMLVLFIFFGDIRASLIVGSSMPISLLLTLILMHFMGFSLNVVTLGALVIAIGMMVDASIVVLESCFRAQEHMPDIREAALEGTKIVLGSIFASTLTTIVVYLPLATMKELAGQMFSQLGYTIVFAMIASLLSAVAFVPLFFSIFQPVEKKKLKINNVLKKVTDWYDEKIRKIMYKKKTVVAVSILLLAASIALIAFTPVELIPDVESNNISVSASFRNGTRMETIQDTVKDLEAIAQSLDEVEAYNLTVGGSSAVMGGGGASASMSIHLEKGHKQPTEDVVAQIVEMTKDMTNMDIEVSSSSSYMSGLSNTGVEIDLEGYDLDALKEYSDKIKDRASDIPKLLSVSSSMDSTTTALELVVDPLVAANYGLTPVQVAGSLYSMVSGTEAMKINNDGNEYSVFLEFPNGLYNTPTSLMNATVTSAFGTPVPVSEIAKLQYTDAQDRIIKYDGKYRASVTAYCLNSDKDSVEKAMNDLVDEIGLPGSITLANNTMMEMIIENFTAILKALAIAIFLIFLVMAIQFESPKYSIMVMLSIPFSMIGSFFLLYITGCSLSMVSLMGVLMLVGIVVNNGILYVDTTNMLRAEGMSIEDALTESGIIRLRPILMTTLTTILSMVPMSLGIGNGTVIMQGMALIIIGGLITSTLLILLLLPTFYLIFYQNDVARKEKKAAKRRESLKRRKAAAVAETEAAVVAETEEAAVAETEEAEGEPANAETESEEEDV